MIILPEAIDRSTKWVVNIKVALSSDLYEKLCLICAGRENRTLTSSLARTCPTTKRYPRQKQYYTRKEKTQNQSDPRHFCAPGGIRTPNNGSEDRYDIHFTTGAMGVSYATSRKNQKSIVK